MKRCSRCVLILFTLGAFLWSVETVSLDTTQDALIRMPGTQPDDGVSLRASDNCLNCHAGYDAAVEQGFNWQGSMMAQAGRDPIFWASVAVAAQDSIWATGRPNATDICLRCHAPAGWVEGRSDPTNGSALTGYDHDGVECVVCHRSIDPFFESIYSGLREGSDWSGYWDETNASDTPSQPLADAQYSTDWSLLQDATMFNGDNFFGIDHSPLSETYTEAGGGQLFIDPGDARRAPFADAAARHELSYSRFHKSKYFCNSCHDVSNPVLANLAFIDSVPGSGEPLPTETLPAYAYFHVERTFSEFMSSAYAQPGGAPGIGPYAPENFTTSVPGNYIASCQSCHMPAVPGKGCDKQDGVFRPDESVEHPNSGQPVHDFAGGNALWTTVLASTVPSSLNYDVVNETLLKQGGDVLTLDLTQGLGLDPDALLDAANRAVSTLQKAASIEDASYNSNTGECSFRIQNQTGHRLLSGYPEGRRLFANVKLFDSGALIYEINPYDPEMHTLKGLPASYSPNSPPLADDELYVDALVYEAKMSSLDITGEQSTFHFALASNRYKDNRIPPKGYDVVEAAKRLSMPVWQGVDAPNYFSPDEYSGGYEKVSVPTIPDGDRVEIRLYYQSTSREYIEFLRNEINGTPPESRTLPDEAYVAQSDDFFSGLRAWGNTIWDLWLHNADVPGAAPVLVAESIVTIDDPCIPQTEACDGEDNDCDGQTDENYQGLGTACTVGTGECQRTGAWICNQAQNGIECNALPGVSSEDICDGLDNDCDGTIDEDFPGRGTSCTVGIGECENQGTWVCNDVGIDIQCSVDPGAPSMELCDGLDNDCDGNIDEAFPELGLPCTAGLGDCAATGTWVCTANAQDVECDAEVGSGTAEVCDARDNDCNGVADDGILCECTENGATQVCYTGPPGTLDTGLCQGGSQTCNDGTWSPCAGDIVPSAERCDSADNDCDTQTDEDFPQLTTPCTVGLGLCEASGAWICSGDQTDVECSAVPGSPVAEQCNDLDDDCDGDFDEDWPGLGTQCAVGLGECRNEGTWVCSGTMDASICSADAGVPSAELCDGFDNDCDGQADEDFPELGLSCTRGLGSCMRLGLWICSGDGLAVECNAESVVGAADDSSCNGVDDDCDGTIDEDCFCTNGEISSCYSGGPGTLGQGQCHAGTQVCSDNQFGPCIGETVPTREYCDGLDNDCDGQADEDFPDVGAVCVVGMGECAWSGIYGCSLDGLFVECDAEEGSPEPESCDGYDNDCDGITDEDFSAGTPCDDGNPCTANDIYDGACGCAGSPYTCSPGICQASSVCDGLGSCVAVDSPDGTPCDDGNGSPVEKQCLSGECVRVPATPTPDAGVSDDPPETSPNPTSGGCSCQATGKAPRSLVTVLIRLLF